MSDSTSVDLLQCIDVAKWYENGHVQALSGIDLSMKSGEIVALTDRNMRIEDGQIFEKGMC